MISDESNKLETYTMYEINKYILKKYDSFWNIYFSLLTYNKNYIYTWIIK